MNRYGAESTKPWGNFREQKGTAQQAKTAAVWILTISPDATGTSRISSPSRGIRSRKIMREALRRNETLQRTLMDNLPWAASSRPTSLELNPALAHSSPRRRYRRTCHTPVPSNENLPIVDGGPGHIPTDHNPRRRILHSLLRQDPASESAARKLPNPHGTSARQEAKRPCSLTRSKRPSPAEDDAGSPGPNHPKPFLANIP